MKSLDNIVYMCFNNFIVLMYKCNDGIMPFVGAFQRAGGGCEPVPNTFFPGSLLPEQVVPKPLW